MAAPVVFTYYTPVRKFSEQDQQQEIAVWRASWAKHGWAPTVLDRTHVERAPNWEELTALVARLPTVNPPGYDLNCYLRWLALSNVGGGLLVDYDVVNLGYTPAQFSPAAELVCFCPDRVPAMVWATATAARSAFDSCATYVVGPHDLSHKADRRGRRHPHVSDMTIWQNLALGTEAPCCFGASRQQVDACLIHCSHWDLWQLGVRIPRWQYMQNLAEHTRPKKEE